MNIRFLFDFINSQRKTIEISQELIPDFTEGYLAALYDFEQYLKQAIELTKNDKSK